MTGVFQYLAPFPSLSNSKPKKSAPTPMRVAGLGSAQLIVLVTRKRHHLQGGARLTLESSWPARFYSGCCCPSLLVHDAILLRILILYYPYPLIRSVPPRCIFPSSSSRPCITFHSARHTHTAPSSLAVTTRPSIHSHTLRPKCGVATIINHT